MSISDLNTPEYSQFIHRSRYARWDPEKGRRETWDETVDRLKNFWLEKFPSHDEAIIEATEAVRDCKVVPSMRTLMTAGKALDKDNVAGYNCSYVAVDNPKVFDETMYVLMCGTGLGFSVERQFITKLPVVAEEMHPTDTTIVVRDSKIGWATAYRELISLLYQGKIPKWDTSKVRPSGAKLKTFGGRASGPEPLESLFRFTIEIFRGAVGRKLTSLECHDIMCKVADIVVVGGVRRSALISLSNLSDTRMRDAKSGQWWIENPQRALANNSVCYTDKPDMGIFLEEWKALYDSKSGERGIFNREAAEKLLPERREKGHEWGTNPCSEIVLRSKSFCNLTEVIIRPEDTLDQLKEKVRLAAILGTLQATLTNFRYLSSTWKKNTEEEALLGVSLTGIMDHPVMSGRADVEAFAWQHDSEVMLKDWLNELKETAIETNKKWAEKLGINPAAAITAVKPSGTVSQLMDTASGIHPRYSPYYIRTVRADKKDPLAQLMKDEGFPVEDDFMKPDTGYVFSFPIKSPSSSVMRDEVSAIDQLEIWKVYQEHWCEHKPSITVYVKEHEWLQVGAWVYEHFDILSGVSFLPHSEHSYQQAPYQECTEEYYKEFLDRMPKNVDWGKLQEYEKDDEAVTGVKEYACTGNSCELV